MVCFWMFVYGITSICCLGLCCGFVQVPREFANFCWSLCVQVLCLGYQSDFGFNVVGWDSLRFLVWVVSLGLFSFLVWVEVLKWSCFLVWFLVWVSGLGFCFGFRVGVR